MRVVLVGDSQAAGLARPLRQLLGRQLVGVNAVNGRATEQMVRDAVDFAQDLNADTVLVASGGNDYLALANPAGYSAMVRAFVEDLSAVAGRGRVHWWGPATAIPVDVARRHDAAASLQQAAVRAAGGTWHDSRGVTSSGHATDGVHLVPAAYGRWARAVAGSIGVGAGAGFVAAMGVLGAGLGYWLARRRRRR